MNSRQVWGRAVCVRCGAPLDAATSADATDATPTAEAVSICFYCGNLGIFTGEGMALREPTAEERAELLVDPEIRNAFRAIFAVRSKNNPATRAPCGCLFGTADKMFFILPCSPTCDIYAYAIEAARKQGKAIDIVGQ